MKSCVEIFDPGVGEIWPYGGEFGHSGDGFGAFGLSCGLNLENGSKGFGRCGWIGFLKFGSVNNGELELVILELYCRVLIFFWPRQYMARVGVYFWFLMFL